MGRDVVADPAADGNDPQGAVGADGLDHEAHLVAVGVQLHHRTAAGVLLAADKDVAHAIHLGLADLLRIGQDGRHHVVLKAGHAVGVGDRGDHLQRSLLIH